MCSGFGGLEKPMQSEPFDYPKGVEDLLSGGTCKTMTPEEQIAQYGETQYGMGGPITKGYYSGPADGVYRYGEGPYAEQTQKYLDSIGMTAGEFEGRKPDSALPLQGDTGLGSTPLAPLPTAPYPVAPAPVTPQIPMQQPEVIKPITPDATISDGGGDVPTIGGGIGGQPTISGVANPFSPFGGRGGMGRQGVRPYLQSIIAMAKNKEFNDIDIKKGPYFEEVQQITDRTFPDLFSGSGMGSLGGFYGGIGNGYGGGMGNELSGPASDVLSGLLSSSVANSSPASGIGSNPFVQSRKNMGPYQLSRK